jgi:hypothetical protein
MNLRDVPSMCGGVELEVGGSAAGQQQELNGATFLFFQKPFIPAFVFSG